MAFGQTSGPPAGARQLDRLGALLERAGFSSFKEARHPYGLTQRQAAGRFTVAEADLLIERLEASEQVQASAEDPVVTPGPAAPDAVATRARGAARSTPAARVARRAELLGSFDDAVLVGELERRGWCCIPPITDDGGEQGRSTAGS